MNQPQLAQDIQQLKQDVHQLQQLQQRSHLPPSFHIPPQQAVAQSAQFLPAMNQPQLAQDVQQLKRDVHQLQQLQQQQNTQIDQILADHAKMNQTLVQINQSLQNKYVLLNCGHDSQMGFSPVPRQDVPRQDRGQKTWR
jgi:transcriptional regulator with PAS, ATPase and Fis domain